jgi:hypothetical protein
VDKYVPSSKLRLMATASHDALEHVLFDYASKHTELFRQIIEKTSQISAYL